MVEARTSIAVAFAVCCTALGGVAAASTVIVGGPAGSVVRNGAAVGARSASVTVTVVRQEVVEDTILVPAGTPAIPWGCRDPRLESGSWRCAN